MRRNFSAAPNLLQARYNHTATLLKDGRVWFTGGRNPLITATGGATVTVNASTVTVNASMSRFSSNVDVTSASYLSSVVASFEVTVAR